MEYSKPFLNQTVKVKIDRPFGTRHPKHGFVYWVNYWYIQDTLAPDWEEIDAYVLGVFEPVDEFEWRCIAIIHRINDDDDKLIIVPQWKNYSDEQIMALTEFQERFFESVIIRA